ncbi:MAG: hypothetical protein K6C97_07110 [Treponema sp.]|nr:hypothetical protein [Treponema sp.]
MAENFYDKFYKHSGSKKAKSKNSYTDKESSDQKKTGPSDKSKKILPKIQLTLTRVKPKIQLTLTKVKPRSQLTLTRVKSKIQLTLTKIKSLVEFTRIHIKKLTDFQTVGLRLHLQILLQSKTPSF